MSLLLSRLSKPALVSRRATLSLGLLSNGFSSSSMQKQTPPCSILGGDPCGRGYGGKLIIFNATDTHSTTLEKIVPRELADPDSMVPIGASHGWVATLKDDGVLRLQDDLNPYASDTARKRIPMPPLVTLPHCQTQVVTNVAMSTSSPEDEDCVVAVKFLGPQLSFCRPGQSKPEWTNMRIQSTCFYSSRVMFSKKDNMFRLLGSGGHLIGSWDLNPDHPNPSFQKLRFRDLPKLTKARRELLDSCSASQHLVESQSTGETFLVNWYKKTARISDGMALMKTRALMVFKLDGEGNAVYTQDIRDLVIFLSESEPFCVPASSFPGMDPNVVDFMDVDETGFVDLADSSICSHLTTFGRSFCIPPQNIPLLSSTSIHL